MDDHQVVLKHSVQMALKVCASKENPMCHPAIAVEPILTMATADRQYILTKVYGNLNVTLQPAAE